jgi:hypothetical protein
MDFTLVTTICAVCELSAARSFCFLDLLADDIECIHWKLHNEVKFPVPSVSDLLASHLSGMNDVFSVANVTGSRRTFTLV